MATWKKIIVSGSQAELAGVTGSFTGSFFGDGSGLSGVTAAGTLSSSAQIADNISGSFSATHLNAKIPGVVSGSAQTIANLPDGTVSGSAQLPDGLVSSSAQTIANLPAGTISGSAQLADDFLDTLGDGVVSGSAQIADDISGSLSATAVAALGAGIFSGSAQVNADSITNFDTNVKAKLNAEGVISSSTQIDGDFLNTTGDDVLSGSAQIADDISGSLSKTALNTVASGLVSSSTQTIANLPAGTVSGSAQTIANLPAGTVSGSSQLPDGIVSSSTQTIANLSTTGIVSGSTQLDNTRLDLADATGSFTGSFTGDGSGLTGVTAAGTLSSSAQIADDISGSFSAAHLNSKVAGVISASAEGSAQGTIALNGVDVDVNGMQTGDSPQFTNLTVSGDLTVSGTTTTVDSTTVEIGDNIIALNGTGATKGGLAVNDGPASGSLLWDGDNDYWIAGPTGSETKVFVAGATGDGLVSGSGQVKTLLPSGTVSGSAQTVANLPSGTVSGSAQTIANLPAGTISGSSQLNDTRLQPTDVTGSFTGSFTGDGSGLTGVVAAGTISSSAQLADDISGSFSATHLNAKIAGIVSGAAQTIAHLPAGTVSGSAQTVANLPAGTVSGSAQTVANLNNQDVDLGTGDITAVTGSFSYVGTAATKYTGSFSGDGSALTNITVDQNATVTSSFSNTATASVVHNFDSDNVLVVAYDDQDEQFIPSTIKAVDSNTIELHFTPNQTGRAIVARGGHIVSGSIPFSNIIALPTLVSSSAQIADDISGSLSNTAIAALGSGIISSSAQIDSDLFDIDGLVSGAAQVTSLLPAGTVSGSAQTIANLPAGTISGSSQLDSTRLNLTDATGSFIGSFTGDGSGLTGVTAAGTLSSSAQIADDISGSLSAAHLNTKVPGLISGSSVASSAQGQFALTTNGVAATVVDLGLQTTDSPTFAGLTVSGDLVVTGDTIESQVTNLNVEDKYILINSGSTSGDSGIIFGGADGTANQGVGLFWDNGYNSNDGRLGIVNSIAAGASGDQTPSYHIAGVFEGTEVNAATAQADHPGNIRVESDEIYIYV